MSLRAAALMQFVDKAGGSLSGGVWYLVLSAGGNIASDLRE